MTPAAVPPDIGAALACGCDWPVLRTETRPRSAAACADTISPDALLLGFALGGGAVEDAPGIAGTIVVAASGTRWRKGSVGAIVADATCADGVALARSWGAICEILLAAAPCPAAGSFDDAAAITADCGLLGVAGCAVAATTGARSVSAPLLAAAAFAIMVCATCTGWAVVVAADPVVTMGTAGGIAAMTGTGMIGAGTPSEAAAHCASLAL